MKFKNVSQVVAWRLCVGCGACAFICSKNKIKLINIVNEGIRPFLDSDDCGDCNECIKVCPGIQVSHNYINGKIKPIHGLKEKFGPILEIWEGYSLDKEIRFHGSSGGLVSALAMYCLDKEKMGGVLHIGADREKPWINKTVISKSRKDVLLRTGSRYSPASPCDSLDYIETAPKAFVFIGKPCDIAGLRKAQQLRQKLKKKVGISIGIFCAGTPSTHGTLELFKHFAIIPEKVEEIRYRGKGWPGTTQMVLKGSKKLTYKISYNESWSFLNKYRPFRCYLCPDCTSEFADISCGDPWYRKIKKNDLGYSILLIRTETGRKIVHGAIASGYVFLKQADPKILEISQKNLLLKRKSIWGRLMAMKIFGIPPPQFGSFYLFKNWCNLPTEQKLRSFLGTVRRIIQRKYFRTEANIIY